ncbi:MAG TPA: ABC-F family ATP-binding cassette domain-containing protein [Gemmatimonadaceae bacterium]|nr:ABC-F family ATP-binding cassette domain-containing protein [Gemmatimonadaceae bacterium]
MSLIAVSGVGVEFGATTLFRDITFTIARGDRWGIVGRNGIGKTTLFKLITGEQQPTSGTVARAGTVRVSLLEQHRTFDGAETVWGAAAGPFAELLALEQSLARQAEALGSDASEQAMARYSRDLERFEREGGYEIAPKVDAVLHGLGFDPEKARTQPIAQLSGGERGRLGLARQLSAPADVLLLDEPTNHLDLETTAWLEQYIRDLDATVVVVSHDRAFLEAVADHVLHFESGTAYAYSGGYADFVTQRAERRLAEQRAFDKQRKVIAAEEDYIRRNIAGQNTRQAKGRRKRLERMPRLSGLAGEAGVMALSLRAAERGGDQVVVAEHVDVAVEGRTLLRDFSTRVHRGDVIGLIGPNGAGKTTLLRTIVGERPPQGGEVRVGGSIALAYYDQQLGNVPMGKTLYDVIADLRPTWGRGPVQGHLGRFGFSGDSVLRTTNMLSGGERARLALAIMMLTGANLLVLDEPTNHLDVESIEALEEAVEGYDGTVILVSHDRALLRALVTRVWVLHHQHITDFPGTFEEWETVSAERAHAAAVTAEEEAELRRVHERQKTARKSETREKEDRAVRAAQRAVEDAEREVSRHEARVAELTKVLEDPELYTTPDGTKKAKALGSELDAAKRALDRAIGAWEKAVEAAEQRA